MRKQLQWCGAVVLLAFTSLAAAQPEAPEEIIVVGKYPGPALWKVSNGDHVLWIFGSLPLVPENMIANMETDIEQLRSNAADWARGDVSAWEETSVGFSSTATSDPCPNTMEARLADKAEPAVSLAFEQWVAAAEEALANNATTFAVLNMDALANNGAIVQMLKSKGYEVRNP